VSFSQTLTVTWPISHPVGANLELFGSCLKVEPVTRGPLASPTAASSSGTVFDGCRDGEVTHAKIPNDEGEVLGESTAFSLIGISGGQQDSLPSVSFGDDFAVSPPGRSGACGTPTSVTSSATTPTAPHFPGRTNILQRFGEYLGHGILKLGTGEFAYRSIRPSSVFICRKY
jgi:hypothetical protein